MDYSPENNNKKIKKSKAEGKKARNKFLLLIGRVLLFVFIISAFAIIGILMGAYVGIINVSPEISISGVNPQKFVTVLYYDETDIEYDKYRGEENREYVNFDEISQYIKDAIVAIEDERFYSHNGIDIKAIGRAVYVTLTTEKTEGGSTITQQLIKNNVAKVNANDIITKLQEQFLAVKYENALLEQFGNKKETKDYILEVYLNTISLNHSLNGVKTASEYYFGKSAKDLTLSESAVIASITKNPSKFTPVNNPEENRERQLIVLKKMLEQDFVTEAEYDEAVADDVYSRITGYNLVQQEEASEVHSYYSDQVFSEVSKDLQEKEGISAKEASLKIINSGYKIYVPIDKRMQDIVDNAFADDSLFPAEISSLEATYYLSLKNNVTEKEEHYERRKTIYNEDQVEAFKEEVKNELMGQNHSISSERIDIAVQPQSAFVVMDHSNGYVMAIGGGRGDKKVNRAFNRATQAKRQPGSVFKVPTVFAAGLELGIINPGTPLEDKPFTDPVTGYTFSNHWGAGFRGIMSMRDAIRDSANVVTVRTMDMIGIDNSFNFLLDLGFTTLIDEINEKGETDRTFSTSLGGVTTGVLQTEVASAYAAFANGGNLNKAKFYTKVIDQNGTIVLDNTTKESKRVMSEGNSFIITDMMKDVVTSGTGGAAKFRTNNMPVSGKTGTTTDTKDLTFVGSTPYYTGSVWLGNDNGKFMTGIYRQDYHMILWRVIMEQIHEGLEVKDFVMPNNIISLTYCKYSGNLASDSCYNEPRGAKVAKEYFVSGSQPTEYCTDHGNLVAVCTETDKLATENCPIESVSYKKSSYTDDQGVKYSYTEYCDIHFAEEIEEEPDSETIGGIVDVTPTEEPSTEIPVEEIPTTQEPAPPTQVENITEPPLPSTEN